MTKAELDRQRAEKNKGKITASHLTVLTVFKDNGWNQAPASAISKKLDWANPFLLEIIEELERIGAVRTKLKLGLSPEKGYTENTPDNPFVVITGLGEQFIVLFE